MRGIYRHLLLLDRINAAVLAGAGEREAARMFCEGVVRIHEGWALLATCREEDAGLYELLAAFPEAGFARPGTLFRLLDGGALTRALRGREPSDIGPWSTIPEEIRSLRVEEISSRGPRWPWRRGNIRESAMTVFPLADHGRLLGFFLLGTRRRPRGYARRLLASVLGRLAGLIGPLRSSEALREAEARSSTLFGCSPVPIWELDISALLETVKDAKRRGVTDGEAWLDFRRESLTGLVKVTAMNDAASRLGVEPFADMRELVRHLFAEEKVFETAVRTTDATGRELILRCRYAFVPGHEEDGRRVVLSAEDETLPRRALEALEWELHANEAMSQLAEAITVGAVGICGLAGIALSSAKLLTASRRGALLWRKGDGKVSAVSDVRLSVPSVPEGSGNMWCYADVGEASGWDWEGKAGDGGVGVLKEGEAGIVVPFGAVQGRRGLLILAGGRYDEAKTVAVVRRLGALFLLAVLRKEEADRLRAGEELYRTVVEGFPLNVYILDTDGRFLLSNRRGAVRHGLAPEEMVGRSLADLFTPDEAAERLAAVRQAAESGATIYREFWQGDRVFEASLTPLAALQPERPSVLVMSRDVTEERRTAEALRRSERMASVGRLAAGVAHEFNNILATVRMAVQDRLQDLEAGANPDTVSWTVFLRMMEDQTRRGEAVVGNLVSFARPPKPMRLEAVGMEGLCERILGMLERQMRLERVRLRKVYGSRRMVLADAALVEQVLMNLLLNARKRLKAAGGGELTLGFREAGDVMRVVVEDDAAALREEVRRNLFDPFFSLTGDEGEDDSVKGSGLGLSVSLRIVRDHGGDLRYEPVEARRGNRFVFELPLAPVTLPEVGGEAPETPAVERVGVFLVEDEPEINEYVVRMLRKNGFSRVAGFVSATEALRRLQEGGPEGWRPDVVLLDLLMPDMGGEEWFREAKRIRSDLKVVVISGQADLERERLAELGVDGFLAKPFDAGDLVGLLRRVLAR